jgi:hypothetical protein
LLLKRPSRGQCPRGPYSVIGGKAMRRVIEQVFETIEANVGHALFAIVGSFALTGVLRLLWE